MARGINKVILIGNLGADPESRSTATGTQVTNLRLATSESWKDKTTGETKENTEWHRVVCFGRLGEIASQYLRKGSKVYIEGRIRTNKWQDKDGQDRYTTEIVGNDMQMLDSRGGNDDFSNAPPSSAPTSSPSPARQNTPASAPPSDQSFEDDDIPF